MYVLRIEDGFLEWKFETGDVIKSSPFINQDTGFVYFGSHDAKIYCLDIKVNFLKFNNKKHKTIFIANSIHFRKKSLFGPKV